MNRLAARLKKMCRAPLRALARRGASAQNGPDANPKTPSGENGPKETRSRFHAKAKGAGSGLVAGLLNGLLGAGGGMAVVPLFERAGLPPTRAHATSIAVIVPLCALSAALYLLHGSVRLGDMLPYLPAGLAGAYAGAKLLPHIPAEWLRRVFGAFMLYAAVRLLLR